MKKFGQLNIRGLRGKTILLCVVLVITASVAFSVIGFFQLRSMASLGAQTSESQSSAIKQKSQQTLEQMIRESMIDTITLSANQADGEFWTMQHDFTMLAEQVQDVLENPDRYEERELRTPDRTREGEYALQILFPDEETSKDAGTLELMAKLANLEPMMREIVRGSDEYTKDCYIALPNGATLAMDTHSARKYDRNGALRPYDPRLRPWYIAAVNKGSFCFTLAVRNFFINQLEVEYGCPIYLNGELAAVLQGSTKLDVIREFVSDVGVGENGFSIMISDEGQLVYSPRETGELQIEDAISTDIRETWNESLIKLIEQAQTGDSGFCEVEIDGESCYAAYAGMPTAGWTMITFVPKADLERPTEELLDAVDAVGTEARKVFGMNFSKSSRLMACVVILLVMTAFAGAVSLSGKILNPINVMTRRIEKMTGDRFDFQMDDVYRTGDEIEILAGTFGRLSAQIKTYLQEILTMTAEKERVSAELAVATKIQADMLPGDFPAFPERKEFDLFASMSPAKEVAGDFYDFFLLDDDHLGMVIADVSDKGVPAALFMMSAKILLNYRAQLGGTPGEILEAVNNQLCRNNESSMFVTVWLGILEISTGRLTCSNAGHEYPFIRRHDSVFRLYRDRHGPALGVLEQAKYHDYELEFHPGDAVFVYTDGVHDARNAEMEFFGMERLETTLGRMKTDSPKEVLESIKTEVDAFAAGEKPFDDLTMLCMIYRGRAEHTDDEGAKENAEL